MFILKPYEINKNIFKISFKFSKGHNEFTKNKINILEIIVNFQRRILGRVTVVLEKESWGIRISLNIMKSVQVFNEILLIGSRLFQKIRNHIKYSFKSC